MIHRSAEKRNQSPDEVVAAAIVAYTSGMSDDSDGFWNSIIGLGNSGAPPLVERDEQILDEILLNKILAEDRELLRDVLEVLVDGNPELRLDLAITLWHQGKISMCRAVEMAQSDRESFKDELAARGIEIVIDVDTETMLRGEELIRRIRGAQ